VARLRGGKVRLGVRHLRLLLARVDGVEEVALPDVAPFLEVHALEEAGDTRADLGVLGAVQLPDPLGGDRVSRWMTLTTGTSTGLASGVALSLQAHGESRTTAASNPPAASRHRIDFSRGPEATGL
jgi:hypothetical protein